MTVQNRLTHQQRKRSCLKKNTRKFLLLIHMKQFPRLVFGKIFLSERPETKINVDNLEKAINSVALLMTKSELKRAKRTVSGNVPGE